MDESISTGNGFLLEFMGSMIFYFVIACCALDARGIAKTHFPAIPIGFILVVVHICLIPYTGCGVNPARTFGPSMVTCMTGKESCDLVVDSWYWIYYIGPFAASYVVAEMTNIMQCDVDGDFEESKAVEVDKSSEGDNVKKDGDDDTPEVAC